MLSKQPACDGDDPVAIFLGLCAAHSHVDLRLDFI
jgi:hypothetical protein